MFGTLPGPVSDRFGMKYAENGEFGAENSVDEVFGETAEGKCSEQKREHF